MRQGFSLHNYPQGDGVGGALVGGGLVGAGGLVGCGCGVAVGCGGFPPPEPGGWGAAVGCAATTDGVMVGGRTVRVGGGFVGMGVKVGNSGASVAVGSITGLVCVTVAGATGISATVFSAVGAG